jgi:excisionase family DNA binding protein
MALREPSQLLPHGPTVGQPLSLLTLHQVAATLAVSVELVQQLTLDRLLRVRRIGTELRVHPEDLRAFIDAAEE